MAQHSGFQTKLQVTRNLFERIPDIILFLEQLRMGRVFEVKKFSRRKHLNQAPARRVSFCPPLVSRTSHPRAFSPLRNSSLFRKSFASLASSRCLTSSAISAGICTA